MSRILILYGSTEGQTATIAEHVADVVRGHGHDVDVADVKRSRRLRLDPYDAVVVGASIHMGKHDHRVVDFVTRHREALEHVPSAFFSVSLAAHGDEGTAERYVEELERRTGWRPAVVARFAGALRYTRYGILKRHMMKRIALDKPGGLGTDISRDYEYTDWAAVERFADDVVLALTTELA
ncbi:flavodoxin domain-containing protein [Mumia sp. DW29H23]|uniref:flavodoxin domain-containing protein n=1 Tax=Mumia sp. DW29H23 TaxID=3421241 RepID=UPI003D68D5F9